GHPVFMERPRGAPAASIEGRLKIHKFILAAAAIATFTVSALPANAQQSSWIPRGDSNCTAGAACGNSGGGGGSDHCDSQLGYLPRVYKPEVAAVDNSHRVWITELCPSFSMMRSEGNAAYLRTTIADNDVLVEALGRKAYK